MDQNRLLGLMALRDGFGSLSAMGGGAAGPQTALPMALRYKAQQAEQEKLQQALQRAREGGGLPAGVNPAAFDAFASVAPGRALQVLASPEAQPDPWRDKRVVGGSVVQATPGGGVESIYTAPQSDQAKAQSAIAKLTADYRAGLIDAETYKAARTKALRDPNGITIGPDGTVQIGGAPRKLTEQQSKFTLFGNMMKSTMPVINSLEEKFNPANVPDSLAARAGSIGEFFKSNDYQKYEAAGRAWAEGVLRLQTGAAATQPEIERVFQTYFAQPGNDQATIEYKRQLRSQYADAIQQASGGLVDPNAADGASSSTAAETQTIDGGQFDFTGKSEDDLRRRLQELGVTQ